MFRAGSLVLILAALIGAGRLWAESKEQKLAKPVPRTRVALLNLTAVIKNYDKYKYFQEEIKKVVDPFLRKELHLRQKAEALQKKFEEAANAAQPISREEYEEQAKELRRKKEDLDTKARKAVGKKNDEAMKALFLDVEEAAKRYAIAHDFDLLLHYNDATTEEDMNCVQNIARKLKTEGFLPIYSAPGIDISKDIIELLNRNKDAAQ